MSVMIILCVGISALILAAARHDLASEKDRRNHDASMRLRRLDPVFAAARQQRTAQPIPRHLHRTDLGGQPVGELILIAHRRLTEAVNR
ncbi:hypothetical protein ACTMTF_42825 [Nonomuraea sp. ZG12]|uniref:hypothetical protein n=1 Tax=Nonomuraea sp. ZG12 TaxID=3452207 RepID=UPI003F88DCAC